MIIQRRLWLATLLVLMTLQAGRTWGQAPTWAWATTPGNGDGRRTVVDAAGNVYVSGWFRGTATFGPTTLTSVGSDDLFVAKLTSTGSYVWAVSAGCTGTDSNHGLAVDHWGNVYVSGFYRDAPMTLGPISLPNNGDNDIFVAKLNAAGGWQWAVGVGGANDDQGRDVKVDSTGNVYVSGEFGSSSVSFDSTVLTNSGSSPLSDVFVAKLSLAGRWQWAVSAGSNHGDTAMGLAVDGTSHLCVVGSFSGPTFTIGTTTLTNVNTNNTRDVFVAKLDTTGLWHWATSAGGPGDDYGFGIDLDSSGNVYVSGLLLSPTAGFGPITLTNVPAAFVAMLAPAGTWQWAEAAGSHSRGVVVAAGGTVYIGGMISGTVAIGATTLTSQGSNDIFVAKRTRAGTWEWAVSAGGTDNDQMTGISLDGAGNVYVTGYFGSPSITFGSTMLANPANDFPIFIARLGTNALSFPDTSPTAALSLYPNPAHATVQLTGASAPIATLLDGLGRTVRTVATPAGTASLDMRGLAPGVYTVRAGLAARRLVVE